MAQVDFWYEFASTYSYPAAMRIEALARARGVKLNWRPFLLGPLFAAQGWRDSPFNIYPAKGRYMWRDMERICARFDLPLVRPDPFPQHSLLATRVALIVEPSLRPAFSRGVYKAEFAEGRAISDVATLAPILEELGLDPAEIFARAQSDLNKQRLKDETARALEIGLPGAPCLVASDGEVFWGNDRLEEGLEWALAPGAHGGVGALDQSLPKPESHVSSCLFPALAPISAASNRPASDGLPWRFFRSFANWARDWVQNI
jgi:2-hydroxychromene-2-carboxylate isomerase